MRLQYGVVNISIHWQCNATVTHGGCRDIVLDAGIGDGIKAIENCGIV